MSTSGPYAEPFDEVERTASVILAYMQAHPGWHDRRGLIEATGIVPSRWTNAINRLLSDRHVRKHGELRATKYRAVSRATGAPAKATGDASAAAAAILAHLRATPGLHGKSAMLAATGIDEAHWNAAIKQLVEEGQVRKEGEKKGARYGVAEGSSVQQQQPIQAPPTVRYSDAELAEFKVFVEKKLAQARRDYATLVEELENREVGEGSSDAADVDDSELATLLGKQEKYIKHLEDALLRIQQKTYGICRVTGRLISKERLRLVPHTTLSVEGKRQVGS